MPRIISEIVDVFVFRRAAPDRCEFLMLRRSDASQSAGTWQSVHGGIEAGETSVMAALRELQEETGLRPTRFWQLESVNTFFDAHRDAIHFCPGFAAEVMLGDAVELNDEHTAFRWVAAANALSEFLWPGQRHAIREILDVIIAKAPAEALLQIPPAID